MPLILALLQNLKGAGGRWAGPGLVGGAGRVRMCACAVLLCACGGSLLGLCIALLQMRIKLQEQ